MGNKNQHEELLQKRSNESHWWHKTPQCLGVALRLCELPLAHGEGILVDSKKKNKKRTTTFGVRMTPEEIQRLDETAKKAGINRNDLIRLSVQGNVQFVDVETLHSAVDELRRLECHIEKHLEKIAELALRITDCGESPESEQLLEEIHGLFSQMKRLMNEMLATQEKVVEVLAFMREREERAPQKTINH